MCFRQLGKTINVSEIMFKYLENLFVACMVNPTIQMLKKLRYDLFVQKYQGRSGQLLSSYDGVDLSLHPPCRGSLHMHIKKSQLPSTYLAICRSEASSTMRALSSARFTDVRLYILRIKIGTNQRALGELSHY